MTFISTHTGATHVPFITVQHWIVNVFACSRLWIDLHSHTDKVDSRAAIPHSALRACFDNLIILPKPSS